MLRIWNGETGELKRRTKALPSAVLRAAISPDNRWLACATGEDFFITDLETDEPIRRWRENREAWSLSWSADAEWVARNAHIRPVERGMPDVLFEDLKNTTAGVFHPSRLWFAYGRIDGEVHLFDLKSRKRLAVYDAENFVRQLAWSPDGRYLLVASDNYRLTVLAENNLKPVTTYQGHFDEIQSVAWSPDSRAIVSADQSGMVKFWRGPDVLLEDHPAYVAHTIGSAVGALPRLEGLLAQNPVATEKLRLSPDGSRVAGDASEFIGIWEISSGQLLHVLTGHTGHRAQNQPAWGPKGRWLATRGADPFVILWDSRAGQEKHRLIGHAGLIENCVFSPDGDRVATRSTDGTVKLWDVETGREILTIPAEGRMSLAWSEDGRTLFSPNDNRQVWDASLAYTWADTDEFAADLERVETIMNVADSSAIDCVESAFARSRYVKYGEADLPHLKRMMEVARRDPSLIQLDHVKLAMLWCNLEDWPALFDFFL
ncbi:MAG: WD40 repeat domain-containing protein, partial [Verrucomicrobiota bacterium]